MGWDRTTQGSSRAAEAPDQHGGRPAGWGEAPQEQGPLTLIPQSPSEWLTAGALLLFAIAGALGVYWLDTSGFWSHTSARSAQSGEQQMSGRFAVGADGKLLRPADAPQPVVPTKPANMASDGKEGMEAFTHYIVDVVQYMWFSGDTSKLEALSSPECNWCREIIESAKERRDNGGWIEKGELSLAQMTEPQAHPELANHWYTHAVLHRTESFIYDGKTLLFKPEKDIKLVFVATFRDGEWILVGGGEIE